jgi:replicative DNA helicase
MTYQINQTLPNAPDAERTVLGAVLIDNRLVSDLVDKLIADDFYTVSHRMIFEAITALYHANKEIDPVLIAEVLRDKGQIDRIGGPAAIGQLVSGIPHFTGLNVYIDIIKEKSKSRGLLKTCNETIGQLFEPVPNLEQILDTAEQSIYNLRESESANLLSFQELLQNSMTALNERIQPDYKPTLLKTGFGCIDDRIIGFDKDDLIIVGGRPSQGKSTLGLNIVGNISDDCSKVIAVFSLEMSREQMVNKLICSDAGIDYTRFRKGLLVQSELQDVRDAFSRLYEKQIIIDDSSSLTPLQLKARARRIKQKRKRLDLIVVDYLQMMKGSGKFSNRENEVAQISKDLKATAKDLQVPVLAICSLNRASETRSDKRPAMADLRESGQIESDANIVMFIHRPEMYAQSNEEKQALIGQAEIIVAKNREGETGFEKLGFDGKKSRFVELY